MRTISDLSSVNNSIYVLDHNGNSQRKVELSYQPFGISPGRSGELMVMGPNVLQKG